MNWGARQRSVSSGSSCSVAAAAPLELPPPVEVPTAGVITTGLVTGWAATRWCPRPRAIHRPPPDAPMPPPATGARSRAGRRHCGRRRGRGHRRRGRGGRRNRSSRAHAEPRLGVGRRRSRHVAPAVGARSGAELAAGAPTVEVAGDVTLVGVVVAGGAGEMLPPVRRAGARARRKRRGGGRRLRWSSAGACVELVCALTGAEAKKWSMRGLPRRWRSCAWPLQRKADGAGRHRNGPHASQIRLPRGCAAFPDRNSAAAKTAISRGGRAGTNLDT